MSQTQVNCFKCKHFYTTWDKSFPRGCRAFNFKTPHMPSVAVHTSSGSPCMRFEKKQGQ
ncbi:uracil-DNA glycosylase [Bacillus sp. AK128]